MSIAGLTREDKDFFKKQKTFLEGGKENNPFVKSTNSNFDSGDTSFGSYVFGGGEGQERGKGKSDAEEEDKGKSFLDNILEGSLSYLKSTQKSEEDKDRDLMRDLASRQETKFGDFGSGGFKEVAQGLTYGQLAPQTQQMFIPGEKAQGKSLGQRFAGAASGLITGLSTGIPHAGGIGAIGGFFS